MLKYDYEKRIKVVYQYEVCVEILSNIFRIQINIKSENIEKK